MNLTGLWRFTSFTLFVFGLLLSAGCATARFAPVDLAAAPGAEDFPGDGSVTLRRDRHIAFLTDERGAAVADVTDHVQWRLLEAGAPQPRNVTAHYWQSFSALREFEARVLWPDGRIERLDPDKKVDAPFHRQVLYSDMRVVSLPVPTLVPGAVLEYRTTVRHREVRLFSFGATFAPSEPVQAQRLIVSVPAEWEVDHLASLGHGERITFPPEVERAEERVRHVWQQGSTGTRDERAERPHVEVTVRLARWSQDGRIHAGFRDARELSAWMDELARGTDEATPEMKVLAAKLAQEAGLDAEARARRAHRFVVDEIEYCAITLGYGAWRPHTAAEVFSVRYGDCKAKANLLRVLLRELEVPSRLALVNAHGGIPRPFRLPTVTGNFNHMILLVDLPDGTVVVDPTQREVPFGEVPPSVAEADVLPVQPGGAELIVVPPLAPEQNAERLELVLEVGAAGAVEGGFSLASRGASASDVRQRLRGVTHAAHDRVVGTWLRIPGASAKAVAVEGDRRGERALQVRGEVSLPPLPGSSGTLVLRASHVLPAQLPEVPLRVPGAHFATRYLAEQVTSVRLRLPAGITARALPEPAVLQSPFGTYTLSWHAEGDGLRLERRWVGGRRMLGAADFTEARAFFDSLRAVEARAVVLRAGVVAQGGGH